MVALKGIQKTHPRVPIGNIYQLIYLWHREWVLGACLVQIREIYIDPLFSILLSNHYGICQPIWEEDFLYRPYLFQLPDLLPYNLDVFLARPFWLLHFWRK